MASGDHSDDSRVDRAHPDTRVKPNSSEHEHLFRAETRAARPPALAQDPARRSLLAIQALGGSAGGPARLVQNLLRGVSRQKELLPGSAGAAGAAGQSSPTSPRPARAWADPKLQVYVGNLGAANAGVREDAWKARLSDFFGRLCAIETSSFDDRRRCGVVRFRSAVAGDVFRAAGADHTGPFRAGGDATLRVRGAAARDTAEPDGAPESDDTTALTNPEPEAEFGCNKTIAIRWDYTGPLKSPTTPMHPPVAGAPPAGDAPPAADASGAPTSCSTQRAICEYIASFTRSVNIIVKTTAGKQHQLSAQPREHLALVYFGFVSFATATAREAVLRLGELTLETPSGELRDLTLGRPSNDFADRDSVPKKFGGASPRAVLRAIGAAGETAKGVRADSSPSMGSGSASINRALSVWVGGIRDMTSEQLKECLGPRALCALESVSALCDGEAGALFEVVFERAEGARCLLVAGQRSSRHAFARTAGGMSGDGGGASVELEFHADPGSARTLLVRCRNAATRRARYTRSSARPLYADAPRDVDAPHDVDAPLDADTLRNMIEGYLTPTRAHVHDARFGGIYGFVTFASPAVSAAMCALATVELESAWRVYLRPAFDGADKSDGDSERGDGAIATRERRQSEGDGSITSDGDSAATPTSAKAPTAAAADRAQDGRQLIVRGLDGAVGTRAVHEFFRRRFTAVTELVVRGSGGGRGSGDDARGGGEADDRVLAIVRFASATGREALRLVPHGLHTIGAARGGGVAVALAAPLAGDAADYGSWATFVREAEWEASAERLYDDLEAGAAINPHAAKHLLVASWSRSRVTAAAAAAAAGGGGDGDAMSHDTDAAHAAAGEAERCFVEELLAYVETFAAPVDLAPLLLPLKAHNAAETATPSAAAVDGALVVTMRTRAVRDAVLAACASGAAQRRSGRASGASSPCCGHARDGSVPRDGGVASPPTAPAIAIDVCGRALSLEALAPRSCAADFQPLATKAEGAPSERDRLGTLSTEEIARGANGGRSDGRERETVGALADARGGDDFDGSMTPGHVSVDSSVSGDTTTTSSEGAPEQDGGDADEPAPHDVGAPSRAFGPPRDPARDEAEGAALDAAERVERAWALRRREERAREGLRLIRREALEGSPSDDDTVAAAAAAAAVAAVAAAARAQTEQYMSVRAPPGFDNAEAVSGTSNGVASRTGPHRGGRGGRGGGREPCAASAPERAVAAPCRSEAAPEPGARFAPPTAAGFAPGEPAEAADDAPCGDPELEAFLARLGLRRHLPRLLREDVDLGTLAICSERELAELGLGLGARLKIHRALGLREAAAARGPSPPGAEAAAAAPQRAAAAPAASGPSRARARAASEPYADAPHFDYPWSPELGTHRAIEPSALSPGLVADRASHGFARDGENATASAFARTAPRTEPAGGPPRRASSGGGGHKRHGGPKRSGGAATRATTLAPLSSYAPAPPVPAYAFAPQGYALLPPGYDGGYAPPGYDGGYAPPGYDGGYAPQVASGYGGGYAHLTAGYCDSAPYALAPAWAYARPPQPAQPMPRSMQQPMPPMQQPVPQPPSSQQPPHVPSPPPPPSVAQRVDRADTSAAAPTGADGSRSSEPPPADAPPLTESEEAVGSGDAADIANSSGGSLRPMSETLTTDVGAEGAAPTSPASTVDLECPTNPDDGQVAADLPKAVARATCSSATSIPPLE